MIKNVTRKGARKLWNYAIAQHEDHPVEPKKVTWDGNVGLVRAEKRAGKVRYDLALRENGNVRVFYGVTEDGMEGKWSVSSRTSRLRPTVAKLTTSRRRMATVVN